jgi:hypothetical protein
MTEKAEWKIADGEYHEGWVKRLKNKSWILQTEDMESGSGYWKRTIKFIEPSEAALLIMEETEFDLEELGLGEYMVDDKEVTV